MSFKESQRQDYVRNVLLKLGGPYLTNHQIYFQQNPEAGPLVAYDLATGKINFLGVPQRYAFGQVDVLTAVVAHEYANTLVIHDVCVCDRTEARCVSVLNALMRGTLLEKIGLLFFSRYLVRTFFEGLLLGAIRIRNRKLAVDLKAIELLRFHGLDVFAYEKFLIAELNQAENYWFPRNLWYQSIMLRRMKQFTDHLRGAQ